MGFRTISGTIELPEGISETETTNITVQALLETGAGALDPALGNFKTSSTVTIHPGFLSASYNLIIPANSTGGGYKLGYKVFGPEGYLSDAWYSATAVGNTSMNFYDASLLDVSNSMPVTANMTLLPGAMITGTVSLPEGVIAPSDLYVNVRALTDMNSSTGSTEDYGTDTLVLIPEGSNSVQYALTVPATNSAMEYLVAYVFSYPSSFSEHGWYSANLDSDSTTRERALASSVNVMNGNQSNINLTILGFRTISGTISLPIGMTEDEDISLNVKALLEPSTGVVDPWSPVPNGYEGFRPVVIPTGSTSAPFRLIVPANAASSEGYRISYNLNGPLTSYFPIGWYAGPDNMTVDNFDLSERVNMNSSSISGIKLTLMELGTAPTSNVPSQIVTSVQFTDSDTSAGKIGGDITWTEPEDITGVTEYVMYFLNNSDTKIGTEIGHVTTGTAVLAISADTAVPIGAIKLGVFTKNSNGENTTGAAIMINDDVSALNVVIPPEGISSGLWQIKVNNSVYNAAVGKYVKLPDEDNSEGRLPDAPSGASFWYGSSTSTSMYSVGNYLGEQIGDSEEWSGGTSDVAQYGRLVSEGIQVPQVTNDSIPVLNFTSWWEIESMNPQGFDTMNIYILGVNDEEVSEDFFARLNPVNGFSGDDPSLAYTSGGFNAPAIWKDYAYDLSRYAGREIKIVFEFNTHDQFYNAFRGWFIDTDIEIKKVNSSDPNIIGVDNQYMSISPFSNNLLLSPQKSSRNLLMPKD